MGVMDWFRRKKASSGIYSGGPGDSVETAIVINATNTIGGIAAEYVYIGRECGTKDVDWTVKSRMKTSHNNKHFDFFDVALKDGSRRSFWFDITAFFGRF